MIISTIFGGFLTDNIDYPLMANEYFQETCIYIFTRNLKKCFKKIEIFPLILLLVDRINEELYGI